MENHNKNKNEMKQSHIENNMDEIMDEIKRDAFMEGYLYAIQVLQNGVIGNKK